MVEHIIVQMEEERGEFRIGWSPSLRHPVWVAYHVPRTARHEAGKRPNFQKDKGVASSPQPKDYANSGYDRGHMAPNHAIVTRFGPEIQRRTFQMTNVAPQRPGLNRGPWREMEQRISELWTSAYGEIINKQQDKIIALQEENKRLKREIWNLKKTKRRR